MSLFSWTETNILPDQREIDNGWCELGNVVAKECDILYIYKGSGDTAWVKFYDSTLQPVDTGAPYDEIAGLF